MSRSATPSLGKYHAIFLVALFATVFLIGGLGLILPRGLRAMLGLVMLTPPAFLALRWFVNDHQRGFDRRERWQMLLVGVIVFTGLLFVGGLAKMAMNPFMSSARLVATTVVGAALAFAQLWLVYAVVNLRYPQATPAQASGRTGAARAPVARVRVLVVGDGVAAHALAWKLGQSPRVLEVLVAPGNAGTTGGPRCRNVAIAPANVDGIVALIGREAVALTVVTGAHDALVQRLLSLDLPVLGASPAAQRLAADPGAVAAFAQRHALVSADAGDPGRDVEVLALIDGSMAIVLASLEALPMGAGIVSPAPSMPAPVLARAGRELLDPIVLGMAREQAGYFGFLQAHVRVSADGGLRLAGVRVDLDDAAAPAWLLRQQSDLFQLLHAATEHALEDVALRTNPRVAVAKPLPSRDGPNGAIVAGLDVRPPMGAQVFHGATRAHANGTLVVGTHVLSVGALGDDRGEAVRMVDETLSGLACVPRPAVAAADA